MLCSFLESDLTCFLNHSAFTDLRQQDKDSPDVQPELFTPALSGGIKGISEAETSLSQGY